MKIIRILEQHRQPEIEGAIRDTLEEWVAPIDEDNWLLPDDTPGEAIQEFIGWCRAIGIQRGHEYDLDIYDPIGDAHRAINAAQEQIAELRVQLAALNKALDKAIDITFKNAR